MSREEIIRLAREAGVFEVSYPHPAGNMVEVERFAALVAAAEREACAQELKNLQRDAARYRWLTHTSDTNPLMVCDVANNRLFYGWEANDAIDAAMGEK